MIMHWSHHVDRQVESRQLLRRLWRGRKCPYVIMQLDNSRFSVSKISRVVQAKYWVLLEYKDMLYAHTDIARSLAVTLLFCDVYV